MERSPQGAALFDLDGVVLDTETQYTQFWREVGARVFPGFPNFEYAVKGQTLRSIEETYFSGPEREADYRWLKQALEDFEKQMRYDFVPGADVFLRELREAGVKTAMATSSDHKKMDSVLAKRPDFETLFDACITSEDVQHSKPAPDCFVLAAERLGARPQACIVFEDSLNGLKAGRASGAYVVGLATTLPMADVAALADEAIPNFADAATRKRLIERIINYQL